MEQLIKSFNESGKLHHAYCLVGDTENIIVKLISFLEDIVGLKTSSNPDFRLGKFSTLTTEQARELAEKQNAKDFGSGRKIFILQTEIITEEAQNALLKVFEEPTVGTHFFVITPQDILLPTLRSRMNMFKVENSKDIKPENRNILDLKIGEKMSLVKEMTDSISDEEKTKQDAIQLLNQIEKELYERGVEVSKKSLEVTSLARSFLYDRGAPIKMILENVMLSI